MIDSTARTQRSDLPDSSHLRTNAAETNLQSSMYEQDNHPLEQSSLDDFKAQPSIEAQRLQRSSYDGSAGPENYQFQAEISMMPNPTRAEDSPRYWQEDAPGGSPAGQGQEGPLAGSGRRRVAEETASEVASTPTRRRKVPAVVQRSPFEPKDV